MPRHPALLALAAGAIILLLAFAAPLLHMGRGAPPATQGAADARLPWAAQAQPDGSLQVFGLVLGRDTLAQARAQWGDLLQVALVGRLGEVGTLEALVEPFQAGFVSGRLVLTFEVEPATLQAWRERATGSDPMDGGVRRFRLAAADLADASGARIAGLSLVPSVKLSEADLRQRFGAPAETLAPAPGVRLLLYPALGLTAAVPDAGSARSALEYVAPRDFAARRAATLAAIAAAAAPSGTK